MLLRFVFCLLTLLVSVACDCVTATGDGGTALALPTSSKSESGKCPPESPGGPQCTPKGIETEDTSKKCEDDTEEGKCTDRDKTIKDSEVLGRDNAKSRSPALEANGDGLNNEVSLNGPSKVVVENERVTNLGDVDLENQKHDESERGKPPLTPEDRTHRETTQSEAHVQTQAQQSAQQGIPGSPLTQEISTVVSNPRITGEQGTERNGNALNTESSPQTNPHQQENNEMQSSGTAGADNAGIPASTSPAETENTNASDSANAWSVSTPAESESTNTQANNTETPT
ncbi:uncharacterized protein TM35_000681230, partial [Trypanosoma theileri]